MNRLSSLARTLRHEAARRLGLAGSIGLLLAGAALPACLSVAPYLHRTAMEQQRQTASLLNDIERRRLIRHERPKSGEQLKQFTAWFPKIDQNADDLRRVTQQAAAAKVEIGKGEYQVSGESDAAFMNYEVVLPIHGNYDAIRSFVTGVLNSVPHASLAELQMQRPAATSKMVDARIHFTFVYRMS